MADPSKPKLITADQLEAVQRFQRASAETVESWRDVGREISKSLKSLLDTTEIEKKIQKIQTDRENINNQISKTEKRRSQAIELQELSKQKLKDLEKERSDILFKLVGDEASMDEKIKNEEKKIIFAERARKLSEENIRLLQQKNTETYKDENLQKKILDSMVKRKEEIEKIIGVSKTLYNLSKDTYELIKKYGEDYDKLLSEGVKVTGLSKSELSDQYKLIQDGNKTLEINLATNKQIFESQLALTKEYGIGVKYSTELGKSIAQTAKSTGLTADDSVKLISNFAQISGKSLSSQKNMAGFAIEAAKAYDIPLDQLLSDIVNLSEEAKVLFKGNTAEFIKQAAEARKLGTTINSISNTASGLLKFESSIAAELKASALLGKSINLNESRRLFFMGKAIEGEKALQLELQKIGDLTKLNYFQAQSLAEAFERPFSELLKQQSLRKEQLEIERLFPERARELQSLQQKLNELQSDSTENREKELKKILQQQEAEARSALATQAREEMLLRIGEALKPIYDLFTKLEIQVYKFITGLDASVISVGAILAAVGSLIILLKGFGKIAEWTLSGVGRGIGSLGSGFLKLGISIRKFPIKNLFAIAASIAIVSASAIGLAYAFKLASEASFGSSAGLVAALIALGAGLVFVSTKTAPALPLMYGFAGALALVSLAALGVGGAIKFAGEGFKNIGEGFKNIAESIKMLSESSSGVIDISSNLGLFSLALAGLGAAIFLFPAKKLENLVNSLSKLSTVSNSIKMISESAGGLLSVSSSLGLFSLALAELGAAIFLFPATKLESIVGSIAKLSAGPQNIGDISTNVDTTSTGKTNENINDQNVELKQELVKISDKLDKLIGVMSDGLSINIDGQKLNYFAKQNEYKYGQRGLSTKLA